PEPHRVAWPTHIHRADTRDRLDALDRDPLDHLDDFEAAVAFGVERERDHRRRICVGLRDGRLLDLVRQPATRAAHAVAHIVGGLVDVTIERELDGDVRGFLPRLRAQGPDAIDRRDLLLQRFGDLALDDLGRGTAITRLNGDNRRIDTWILAHGQAPEAEQTDQHHDDRRHERDDRAFDGNVGKDHRLPPRLNSERIGRGASGAPGYRINAPTPEATICCASASSPSSGRTSTTPLARRPSCTGTNFATGFPAPPSTATICDPSGVVRIAPS